MRKLVVPVVLAVAAMAMPHVSATDATYAGGCSFASVSDPTPDGNLGGQGAFTGEVDWQVVLYAASEADHNPVSATVSCELQVNGVVEDSTVPTLVTVAGAGAEVLTYTKAAPTDVVELCTVITGWSDGAANVRNCGEATTITIPPEEVIELIDEAFNIIAEATAPVDPVFCGVQKDAGIPAALNSVTTLTRIWIDPDDCDVWIICPPFRQIDYVPYGDPYTGPPCPVPAR